MNTQLIICLVIFALTLVMFIWNKIPLWATAMLSLCLLVLTGCVDSETALSGFSNSNTVLMMGMFLVAAGFARTSVTTKMCDGLMKLTRGSFTGAYIGFVILTFFLTNFLSSPMVCFSIVAPLMAPLCQKNNVSPSKVMFPLLIICVGCFNKLPFSPQVIASCAQYNGYMEQYGLPGYELTPMHFMLGELPVAIMIILWAIFLGRKLMPEQPSVKITSGASDMREGEHLNKLSDTAGIIIFFTTIACLLLSAQINQPAWLIAVVGGILMVAFGVLEPKKALNIPWDMILLFVGALGLGSALTATGAGDIIGNALANALGGTTNSYVLGAVFFIVPFILTQFMLNRGVIQVFVPICILTCKALGANPIGLILLVEAGALTAFFTPMATPGVPMCMGFGGYNMKDLIKSGWSLMILLAVCYVAYTMTVFPAF